jgi:DNA polymerase III sliding clamp (beta) subunit (PCNA family)
MLKELKFVQGAVAKKDLVPAMTHFAIERGTVRAYNGTLALCSPIPFDIDCKPKAGPLVQAISQCDETVTLAITAAGKLRVQSGKFRAYIDCVEGETPHVLPEGQEIHFDGEQVLKAFKVLSTFVGDDASRPWTNGILLRGQSAYATNNVCLAEYWIGTQMPFVVNVPFVAIREMLRIAESPTHAQLTEGSITFHYSNGRWIRSQLYSATWPDLSKVLEREIGNPQPLDERIFEGLEVIKPFADKMGRVFLDKEAVKTHLEDGLGASYELPGFKAEGIYQIEMLNLLKGVAKQIDFSKYPDPCVFYGDRLRGVIVGMFNV